MKTLLCSLALLAAAPAWAAPDALNAALQPTVETRDPRAWLSSVRRLESFGKEALAPMLALAADPAALDRVSGGDLLARGRVLSALAEAISALRDPSAATGLRALVDDAGAGAEARAGAARGLGMLCRAEDISFLAARLGSGPAAIEGLAPCRTTAAAGALLTRLRIASDPAEIDILAKSLGRLGSSWAWEAMGPSRAAEGSALRGRIAAAVVDAYVAVPASRTALARTLKMVESPDTDALLAKAAQRDPAAGELRSVLANP